MKKFLLITFIGMFFTNYSTAQILCVNCYQQNAALPLTGPNLVQNGSFENSPCIPDAFSTCSWCPLATAYGCNIPNWTSMGGGSSTYSCIVDNNGWSNVGAGLDAVYFGNSFCLTCSQTADDISCLVNGGCSVTGFPPGYPQNSAQYGGGAGLSLYQVVTGLTVGQNYCLQFWTGGEQSFTQPGVFGLQCGFGQLMLWTNQTPPNTGVGTRYLIEFKATNTTDTLMWTNWGHICSSCTELVLDDVSLYTAPPDTTAYAAFSASPLTGCVPLTVTFVDSSTVGCTYAWDFGDGNTSTVYNPVHTYITPGTYTVTLIVTVPNSACTGASSDTMIRVNYITVSPGPVAAFTPDTTQGCVGLTVNFANSSTNTVSYLWNFGDGNTSTLTSPAHTYNTIGTFTVTLICYGAGICNDTISQTITILATPIVNLGPDQALCNGNSATFDAGNPGDTYLWSNGANSETITVSTAGQYWVQVTNGLCSGSDTVNVTVGLAAAVELGPDILLCNGGTATLDAGNPGMSYLWSNGQTTQKITATSTGTYFVIVSNNGCTGSDSVNVVIRPPLTVSLGPDTTICPGDNLILNAGKGYSSYSWIPDGQSSPSITIDQPGTYGITVTDSLGCIAQTSIWIADFCFTDMYVPSAFTPTGNNINENFMAYCENVVQFHMYVYNRWGQLVFESEDISKGWDGTYNGSKATQDTYVWTIDYQLFDFSSIHKHTLAGKVTLIR
jgi:gliding motility-associated-like protein